MIFKELKMSGYQLKSKKIYYKIVCNDKKNMISYLSDQNHIKLPYHFNSSNL